MNVDWNAYDSNTDSEGSPNSQESERTLVEAVSVTSSVSLASTIVGSVTSSWYQEFDEISTPGSSASDVTMSDESNGDIGDQNVQYAMHPSRQFELDSNFDTFGPRISSQPTPNPPPLSSLLDTPSKKRKLDSSVKKSLTETEEDGATCSICLDFYDLVGQHRLVCLKCGHCFGESCIRRWIKEQQASKKCCPQCKIKASMRDIRYIFADRLRTRDNSKEVELEQLLEKEKQENSKFKSEVFIFKLELEQQRTNVMNLQRELAAKTSDYMKRESATASASAKVTLPSGCNYKLFMEKNLDLSKESCSKVMVFGSKIKRLLISQKSSQPLFPGEFLKLLYCTIL